MKDLTCGCCGAGFYVWPDYVDQDQDAGYGICKTCQEWIQTKADADADKSIAMVSAALNETNRTRFDAMDRALQLGLIGQMLDEGIITYRITRDA
jgi:hypothetical protein